MNYNYIKDTFDGKTYSLKYMLSNILFGLSDEN